MEGPSVTYISSQRLGKIHTIEASSSTNQDENMESESLSSIGDVQTERVIFSDETSVYLHHLQQTNSFTGLEKIFYNFFMNFVSLSLS